ncbi:MAG: flippase [Eubacteriales bacterium]|nr:flippase [Eubacteriales bacterium]
MIKQKKSIKVNFLYNVIYQILAVCTPLITSPIISRNLGAEAVGIYSYTYSVAYYFLIFGMLGVKNYGSRSIAQCRDSKEQLNYTFWSIYFFQLLSSILLVCCYVFYLLIICDADFKIALIQILLVFSATFDISWLFFGLEMFKTTTLRNATVKIANVILIILLIHEQNDLWKYTAIMAGGVLISQLIMWPFVPGLINFVKPKFVDILKHFKPNLILFIPVVATNIYKYMDKIMLGNISVMTELGYYENAERLIQIPNSLVTALGTVMLPAMSKLIADKKNNEANELIAKSMIFSVFASSALGFGIVSVADVFVPFFFGDEFIPVISLLYILAPIMVFISWGDVIRTQYLIPNMKDASYLFSVVAACIVNLILNTLFIPRLGAQGAAVGTFFAEFLVCFLQTLAVIGKLNIRSFLKDTIPFVAFGIVMFVVIRNITVYNNVVSVLFRMVIGATIYLVLSAIYLWRKHSDIVYSVIPTKILKKMKRE